MAGEVSKPVWVWPAGQAAPVRCGSFNWRDGLGEFSYDEAFKSMPGAEALDPINLPITRTLRPHRETRRSGLFGVLRDASPEGYGLGLLEQLEGRGLDIMDRLEVALGDGVGAIEVCDDIQRKIDFHPTPFDEFINRLAEMPEGAPVSRVVRDLHAVYGTTLGGERPKMTVLHAGQHWIAKLQDRGDAPNSPLREYLAMKAARAVGIAAAEVEFRRAGPHQVVCVRRFDRHVQDDFKVQRFMFASAHTMLGLDNASTRGDPLRSYPYLASALQRWCGAEGVNVREIKRELWRRMAFNAVVGNGDDHARNHGVLHRGGHWTLSPAYDIAPYVLFSGTLALDVTREQSAMAARWALLRDCDTFGYEEAEAAAFIDQAVSTMKLTWEAERAAMGFAPGDAPTPDSESWLSRPPPAALRPKRKPRIRIR